MKVPLTALLATTCELPTRRMPNMKLFILSVVLVAIVLMSHEMLTQDTDLNKGSKLPAFLTTSGGNQRGKMRLLRTIDSAAVTANEERGPRVPRVPRPQHPLGVYHAPRDPVVPLAKIEANLAKVKPDLQPMTASTPKSSNELGGVTIYNNWETEDEKMVIINILIRGGSNKMTIFDKMSPPGDKYRSKVRMSVAEGIKKWYEHHDAEMKIRMNKWHEEGKAPADVYKLLLLETEESLSFRDYKKYRQMLMSGMPKDLQWSLKQDIHPMFIGKRLNVENAAKGSLAIRYYEDYATLYYEQHASIPKPTT